GHPRQVPGCAWRASRRQPDVRWVAECRDDCQGTHVGLTPRRSPSNGGMRCRAWVLTSLARRPWSFVDLMSWCPDSNDWLPVRRRDPRPGNARPGIADNRPDRGWD